MSGVIWRDNNYYYPRRTLNALIFRWALAEQLAYQVTYPRYLPPVHPQIRTMKALGILNADFYNIHNLDAHVHESES